MRIKTKDDRRERIKFRIRKRVRGNDARPRLTVFRSVAHMYVQVVDDMTGRTIAAASSMTGSSLFATASSLARRALALGRLFPQDRGPATIDR